MSKNVRQTLNKELDQSVLVLKLMKIVTDAVYDWLVNSKKECSDRTVQELIDSVIANQIQIIIEDHAGKLNSATNVNEKLGEPHGWRLLNNFRVVAERELYDDLIWCRKNAKNSEYSSTGNLEIEKIDTSLLLKIFFLIFGLVLIGNVSIEEIKSISIR